MRNFKFAWLFSLLTVFSLSFSLTSCGDDDDDVTVNPTAADIVGIWQGVQSSTTIAGKVTTEDNSDQYFQFLEDGTCYDISGDDGNYSVDVVKWSLNGNTLSIDDMEYIVKSFSFNDMLIYTEGEIADVPFSGTLSFKKVFILPPDALNDLKKQ